DTVDVAGMAEPFSGAIRDGKLYGRGSYDMKGSLAACMAAAKALKHSVTRLRGDVLVAAVADEEYGSLGTIDLLTHIKVDGAIVNGGSGLSTYAASSKVQIERRTVPGETEAQATAEIQAIVDSLSAQDADFHAVVRTFFVREPFEVPAGARIVKAVDRAAAKVRGRPAAHIGDTPWMDAALLQAAGVETVVCGAAGAGAHSDVEWVDLESVVKLAEILAEAALEYCA